MYDEIALYKKHTREQLKWDDVSFKDRSCEPGDAVRWHNQPNTYGLIIGVVGVDVIVWWSKKPLVGIDISKFIKPVKQRLYANLAHDLISIQPMSMPSSLIFYHDYTYNSGSK